MNQSYSGHGILKHESEFSGAFGGPRILVDLCTLSGPQFASAHFRCWIACIGDSLGEDPRYVRGRQENALYRPLIMQSKGMYVRKTRRMNFGPQCDP